MTASKEGDIEFGLILAFECFAAITALKELGDPRAESVLTKIATEAPEESNRWLEIKEHPLAMVPTALLESGDAESHEEIARRALGERLIKPSRRESKRTAKRRRRL